MAASNLSTPYLATAYFFIDLVPARIYQAGMDEDILSEIRAFCATHNMKPTRFGELALNDKPFISTLENGRDLKLSTVAKLRDFMANYKADAA